jgi:methyltransferase (TIGR00027 family)
MRAGYIATELSVTMYRWRWIEPPREEAAMDPHGALQGVAKTALGMAMVRARESLRVDRLFNDPYAQRFLDAAPGAFPEQPTSAEDLAELGPLASLGGVFAFHAVLRTRFFDDYLLAATTAGCSQVVLLAAGLDARALRLRWPNAVRVFELDLPEVFAFKEEVLAGCDAVPTCERRTVPVDLRGNWTGELVAAGFDHTAATAWLAEGLLLYLTADEAARLLTGVGELSTPGSQLAFERGGIASSALLAQARGMPTMERYASLWKGGLGEDAAGWLGRHGWRPRIHDPAELAARYGRPVPGRSSGGFLTAVRLRGGRLADAVADQVDRRAGVGPGKVLVDDQRRRPQAGLRWLEAHLDRAGVPWGERPSEAAQVASARPGGVGVDAELPRRRSDELERLHQQGGRAAAPDR